MNKNDHSKIISQFLPIIMVFLSPFLGLFIVQFRSYDDMFYYSAILLLSALVVVGYRFFTRKEYHTNTLDISVMLFLSYIVLNRIFLSNSYPDAVFLLRSVIIVGAYVYMRSISKSEKAGVVLQKLFIAVGLVELIIVVLQLFSIVHSNNPFFDVTGSYNNPSMLGGILLLSAISALSFSLKDDISIRKRMIYSFICLMLAVGVFVSSSRSALVSLVICSFFLLIRTFLSRKKSPNRRGSFIGVIFFIMLLLVGVIVYINHIDIYNEARILIWRVSWDIFRDYPLFGAGIGSFASNYPYYQANYFMNNPDSLFSTVSGDNYQAYNLIISILCELGIVGCLFFAAIIFYIFRCKGSFDLKILFISTTIFLLFNNLFDSLTIVICYVSIMAMISAKSTGADYRIANSRGISIIAGVVIVSLFVYIIWVKSRFDNTLHGLQELSDGQIENTLNIDESIVFSYRPFMVSYSEIVFEKLDPENAITVLDDVLKRMATARQVTLAGDLYYEMGEISKAEEFYYLADNMVPSRIIPSYKLFVLFKDTGQNDKAKTMAEYILNKEVSVVSSVTLRVRAEAKEYLKF